MERGTIGGTPSFYQGYTLDALANWSSFNNNGTTESRSHDVMNAITARGATSLSYDLNGNLINDGNQQYIWDELNRLVEVRDSGNNIICDYYYNADNLRVEKHHAGGAKEQFYYDGATVLVETDGSQTKVREYVNGGQYIDEVILVVNGSTYNYYMSDLRYCVTGLIDSTGAVVEHAKYDGYGKRTLLDSSYSTITTANINQSYGYTGIRHDNESGLQYYRARYFDDDLGRFINRDPLGYVDGLNLYRGYFANVGVDPSGTAWKDLGGDIWEAGSDGDSLEDLSMKVIGNKGSWSCIWPIGNTQTKSNDWKKPSDWPSASKCDTADVSNLTKTEGPSLYVNLWVGDKAYLNARPEALTLLTGNGVENALKNKSNEGATPIQYFEINGHGNGIQPVVMNSTSGQIQYRQIFQKEQQAFQPAPVGSTDSGDEPTATYERAKSKKGPKKCWFTRSAKTYGVMCFGKIFGDSFAGAYLRKGAWMKTTKIDHSISSPSNNDWRIKNNSGSTLESFNSLDNLLQNSVNLIKIDGKN